MMLEIEIEKVVINPEGNVLALYTKGGQRLKLLLVDSAGPKYCLLPSPGTKVDANDIQSGDNVIWFQEGNQAWCSIEPSLDKMKITEIVQGFGSYEVGDTLDLSVDELYWPEGLAN